METCRRVLVIPYAFLKSNLFAFVCVYENCNKMIDMWIKVHVIKSSNLDLGLTCLNFDKFDP